jgi:hypothetical protein
MTASRPRCCIEGTARAGLTSMQQYRAPRWLIGGHVQTIWPALFS